MHVCIDFSFLILSLYTQVHILLNHSRVSCRAEASCCAVGTHHPSLSGAEQVKVMNLIQVPDKRLLFKATVPLIFRCAYWLCHGVEGSKSPLKLENNYSNFFHLVLPTSTEREFCLQFIIYSMSYIIRMCSSHRAFTELQF